jgi:hypothetical protein
MERWRENLKRL